MFVTYGRAQRTAPHRAGAKTYDTVRSHSVLLLQLFVSLLQQKRGIFPYPEYRALSVPTGIPVPFLLKLSTKPTALIWSCILVPRPCALKFRRWPITLGSRLGQVLALLG